MSLNLGHFINQCGTLQIGHSGPLFLLGGTNAAAAAMANSPSDSSLCSWFSSIVGKALNLLGTGGLASGKRSSLLAAAGLDSTGLSWLRLVALGRSDSSALVERVMNLDFIFIQPNRVFEHSIGYPRISQYS
jgi:hypothetical protein